MGCDAAGLGGCGREIAGLRAGVGAAGLGSQSDNEPGRARCVECRAKRWRVPQTTPRTSGRSSRSRQTWLNLPPMPELTYLAPGADEFELRRHRESRLRRQLVS